MRGLGRAEGGMWRWGDLHQWLVVLDATVAAVVGVVATTAEATACTATGAEAAPAAYEPLAAAEAGEYLTPSRR